MFPLKYGLLLTCILILCACGNNAELESKLESVSQCIQAPLSIRQSYDSAIQEDRIPVYLSYENKEQYSHADWYQTNKSLYDAISWDLEDWSTISDLSECDQALGDLEADYPKNGSVKQMRRFLGFNQIVFKKYHKSQIEDASIDLYGIVNDAQTCLFTQAYPQAFITMNYDATDKLFPMAFLIDWDGDDFSRGTATVDGRDPLWRPIKSVKDTGCLDKHDALSDGFIDWALSSEDDFNISWSDHAEYTDRFKAISEVVDQYNAFVEEQHKALKAAGESIPSMGPYSSPIIHKVDLGYVSDFDFKQLMKTCESTPPETFVNGRGETLTSPSQECSLVQTLCNKDGIQPPLDEKACAPYVYK